MGFAEPLARELMLESLGAGTCHRRSALALGCTFGKLIFWEQKGLKDVRQKGTTFHVLVILNVCSVPQMCIDNVAHVFMSSNSQESKLTQSLPCSVIYVPV